MSQQAAIEPRHVRKAPRDPAGRHTPDTQISPSARRDERSFADNKDLFTLTDGRQLSYLDHAPEMEKTMMACLHLAAGFVALCLLFGLAHPTVAATSSLAPSIVP